MIKLNLNKSSAASSGRLCALKRAAALIIAATLTLALLFTACPNNAGGSGSGSATPPTPSAVGSFEDTGDGFVKIIPPATGIVGVDPDYTLPGSQDYWKGVFRAGRKVKLSPYKLAKQR